MMVRLCLSIYQEFLKEFSIPILFYHHFSPTPHQRSLLPLLASYNTFVYLTCGTDSIRSHTRLILGSCPHAPPCHLSVDVLI